MVSKVKTAAEIAAMRIGGKMLATVLDLLCRQIQAGMTTKDLANIAARELKALGGQPAFLGYQGFGDVLCVSVNDEIVHGIPGNKVIGSGDIVGLDFGVIYDGLITDGAVTVGVGQVSNEANRLLTVTQQALNAGVDQVKAGARVGDIGAAVEAVLRSSNLGVIEDMVGHGVGHSLHEDPQIPNFGTKGTGTALKAGMTIAIEPMATLGAHQVQIDKDGWTIRTADGSLAAQFEHTVLVTDAGFEVLTTLKP